MIKDPLILYIEDERSVLELVRTALKLAGYEILSAMSGEEGLAIMRIHKPDLLLLDLMMPGTNGWEVYRSMKKDEYLADVPVIVVTARIPENNSYTIIEGLPPVEDYITKPFDMWRLIRAVENIIK